MENQLNLIKMCKGKSFVEKLRLLAGKLKKFAQRLP